MSRKKNYIDEIEIQYKDDAKLNKRLQIHSYSDNKTGLYNFISEKLVIKDSDKILELGCGNGELWKNIINTKGNIKANITLSDISEGMIKKAQQNLKEVTTNNLDFKTFDVHDIPFENDTFDIVIADHILYHASNIELAIAEIKRVLKPNGKLYASTIGKGHMRELIDLVKIYRLPIIFEPDTVADTFGLENGHRLLQEHFKNVELFFYKDSLRIPKAQPVITYIESLGEVDYNKYINKRRLDRLVTELERRLEIDKNIYISKNSGMFVAFN